MGSVLDVALDVPLHELVGQVAELGAERDGPLDGLLEGHARPDPAVGAVVLEGGPGLPRQLQVTGGHDPRLRLRRANGEGVRPVQDVVADEAPGRLRLGGALRGEGRRVLGVAALGQVAAPLVGGDIADGAFAWPAPGGDWGAAVHVPERAERPY